VSKSIVLSAFRLLRYFPREQKKAKSGRSVSPEALQSAHEGLGWPLAEGASDWVGRNALSETADAIRAVDAISVLMQS
jgi:hypothetical protein